MSSKDKPLNDIKDILVVDDRRVIRLLFNEKHNRILRMVTDNEMSVSDIARSLNINPGSVFYYLKELEKAGLVRQVREEIKGGIVKKYYHSGMDEKYVEKMVRSIEFLGYYVPPENMEEARDFLLRYDKRMKSMKAMNDPELTRLHNQFPKIFLQHE